MSMMSRNLPVDGSRKPAVCSPVQILVRIVGIFPVQSKTGAGFFAGTAWIVSS